MASLQNKFVSYVDRSLDQIKDNVLTKFQINVPEVTDHTESNPWVKAINIWAALVEMLGYYIDRRAQEVYISYVRKFADAIDIATLFNYRAKGTIPAKVDLRFYIDAPAVSDIIIPINSEVQTGDGIIFLTTEAGTILTGQIEVFIPAEQVVSVTGTVLGTSDGAPNQKFEMEDNVVDNSVSILVSATSFTNQETLAYSFAADNHFVAGLNKNALMEVRFGDDINGAIPASTQDVVADYKLSEGENGNVGAGTITQINSAITVPGGVTLKVENQLDAAGGADQENLSKLQKNIPLSIRTNDRMVTDSDYKDQTELAPGVAKAAIDFNCANTIDIYIAPDGGGIASGALIATTESFVETKKIVGRAVNIKAAGEITIQFQINLFVLSNFVRATIVQAVKDALTDFLSSDNQEIGATVYLSDMYEVIENVDGVDNSDILVMTGIPYARPVNNTTVLSWSRIIQSNSDSTNKWQIIFTSSTDYILKKNGTTVGTFSVGNQVFQDEIIFTINAGSYVLGDQYEFYTYRYTGTVNLQELSIPVTDDSNIVINGFGGIA